MRCRMLVFWVVFNIRSAVKIGLSRVMGSGDRVIVTGMNS